MAGLLNPYSNISPYHPGVEYPRLVRKLVTYSNERKIAKKGKQNKDENTMIRFQLYGSFTEGCTRLEGFIANSERQVPPGWSMADLVRAASSNQGVNPPGLITSYYYGLLLHGQNSWLCQELFDILSELPLLMRRSAGIWILWAAFSIQILEANHGIFTESCGTNDSIRK